MSTFNDLQLRVLISQTEVSGTPSYNLDLHGDARGLRELVVGIRSQFEEIEGAYAGLAKQGNLKRKTGTISLNVLLDSTTKVFMGKEEDYCYGEDKEYEADGTTLLLTRTWAMRLTRCEAIMRPGALNRIAIEGVPISYVVA